MEQTQQKKSWGSLYVIAALLVVALVASVIVALVQPRTDGNLMVQVTVYGNVEAVMPLNEDARQIFITDDGRNTVVVENGSVHIEDADCDGGDCMKQGSISQTSQLLVCLPHQLIVEIVPAARESIPSVYTGNEQVGAEEIDAIMR